MKHMGCWIRHFMTYSIDVHRLQVMCSTQLRYIICSTASPIIREIAWPRIINVKATNLSNQCGDEFFIRSRTSILVSCSKFDIRIYLQERIGNPEFQKFWNFEYKFVVYITIIIFSCHNSILISEITSWKVLKILLCLKIISLPTGGIP